MKECPNCKTMLEDDVLYCHECGTKQEIEKSTVQDESSSSSGKKCSQCGELIEENSDFCPYCGKKQIKEEVKNVEETKYNTEEEKLKQTSEPVSQGKGTETTIEKSEDNKVTEGEKKSTRKWVYFLTTPVLLCGIILFGFFYIRAEHEQKKSVETNEDAQEKEQIHEKYNNPYTDESPLEYETFLAIYKALSPTPKYYSMNKPSQELLNKYHLDCIPDSSDWYKRYYVGRNIKLDNHEIVPEVKYGWCFMLHRGEEPDNIKLKFFDTGRYYEFVGRARAYGMVEIKMYSEYEDQDYVGNILFAALTPHPNSTILITSDDEMIANGVIGPLIFDETRLEIDLSTNDLIDFSR